MVSTAITSGWQNTELGELDVDDPVDFPAGAVREGVAVQPGAHHLAR